MKTLLESEEFRAELPGWALRGILCAANSAFWAALMGFQAPVEIAGMAAGVGFWVAVFTGVCAWTPQSARWNQREAVRALKWAAGIKIGLTAVGWLVFAVAGKLNSDPLAGVALFGMIDMLLGLVALSAVSFVAGMKGPEAVAAADSFEWTALTTVTEGALMALVIGGLALLVWASWRFWPVLKARVISPVRFAG